MVVLNTPVPSSSHPCHSRSDSLAAEHITVKSQCLPISSNKGLRYGATIFVISAIFILVPLRDSRLRFLDICFIEIFEIPHKSRNGEFLVCSPFSTFAQTPPKGRVFRQAGQRIGQDHTVSSRHQQPAHTILTQFGQFPILPFTKNCFPIIFQAKGRDRYHFTKIG